MKQLDTEGMLEYLRKHIAAMGSQKTFSDRHQISEQYVSDVMNGRRDIGEKILDALHFERVVTYRRKVG